MSHEDNETMMRIYEAVAVRIGKDTTLSLSHVAPCGSTSISSVTQAVADHQVCAQAGGLNMLHIQQVQLGTRDTVQ